MFYSNLDFESLSNKYCFFSIYVCFSFSAFASYFDVRMIFLVCEKSHNRSSRPSSIRAFNSRNAEAWWHDRIFIKAVMFPSQRILLLTNAVYRAIGLCHRDHLEKADASAVATFRLWYPRLALLVEEAGLVHIHR